MSQLKLPHLANIQCFVQVLRLIIQFDELEGQHANYGNFLCVCVV